jgi:hypothetical protein
MMSCVAGALRSYLRGCGEDTDGCEIRAMVPVNLRSTDGPIRLGNRFGLVPVELPVGIANPIARLQEVRRRMVDLKGGYQAVLTYTLLDSAGGRFALDGSTLKTAAALDYETATSHQVTVRVTDSSNATFDKVFSIGVTNVNEGPTAISLSAASVAENAAEENG